MLSLHGVERDEWKWLKRELKPEYTLPTDVAAYLAGIGDIVDPEGRVFELDVPYILSDDELNGVRGFFGRIDADTHVLYETIPSPGVVSLLVCEDVRITNVGGANEWDPSSCHSSTR